METKLVRIAEMAGTNPEIRFTSLYHYLNEELLLECHRELEGNKAIGIDGVTKDKYEENLQQNIEKPRQKAQNNELSTVTCQKSLYPKGNGEEKRPLGIVCYEDKIAEQGLNKILQAVFEPIFLDCSFGFRPKRGCHEALKKLNSLIEKSKVYRRCGY